MMILAKKKNMTQAFDDKSNVIPVTVLDYSECFVAQGEGKSKKFVCIGTRKKTRKPERGIFGENVPEKAYETFDEAEQLEDIEQGDTVTLQSTSKGKGFAGVVKMWRFKGGPKTHGQSDRLRHPGSIGAGTTQGRVFKGMKMAKRKGGETVTLRNIPVVSVDTENKLISVKGSVPGAYDSIVKIRKKK